VQFYSTEPISPDRFLPAARLNFFFALLAILAIAGLSI
jgi:hypothetical protein